MSPWLSKFWKSDRFHCYQETEVWMCIAQLLCIQLPTDQFDCCSWSNAVVLRGHGTIWWTHNRWRGVVIWSRGLSQNQLSWPAQFRSRVNFLVSCHGGKIRGDAWKPNPAELGTSCFVPLAPGIVCLCFSSVGTCSLSYIRRRSIRCRSHESPLWVLSNLHGSASWVTENNTTTKFGGNYEDKDI